MLALSAISGAIAFPERFAGSFNLANFEDTCGTRSLFLSNAAGWISVSVGAGARQYGSTMADLASMSTEELCAKANAAPDEARFTEEVSGYNERLCTRQAHPLPATHGLPSICCTDAEASRGQAVSFEQAPR